MPRHKLGQRSDQLHRTAPATPPPPGLVDLEPTIVSIDVASEPVLFKGSISSYDPAVSRQPILVTAVALPVGMDEPADAQAWLDSAYPKGVMEFPHVEAAQGAEAAEFDIAIPNVPDGLIVVQLVLTYAE